MYLCHVIGPYQSLAQRVRAEEASAVQAHITSKMEACHG
jgi:hypothetical protein